MLEIIWDQSYSVNIVEIDRQHQKLAALLDHFLEEIAENRSGRILGQMIRELIAYAGYHFDTEESLMKRHGFPDFDAHQKEHDRFRATVKKFKEDLAGKKETLAADVMNFMTHWLTDHVMAWDKKYAPFLHAKGVF